MFFLRQVGFLLWKDVLIEWRARELLLSTILFSVIVVLLFSFAFLGGALPTVEVLSGVLWVAVSLSGMLGISRSFEKEREADTLRALLSAPIDRAALYVAKLIAITLLMWLTSAVVVPALCLLFGLRFPAGGAWFVALLALGTTGFAAVAALFGASLGRARAREVLLPLLVYPLVLPALLASARGTYGVLYGTPESLADAVRWVKFLVVFDSLAIVLGLWLFEPLTTQD
ncbi:MAG TPA: heme exporter protein CcmB [Pseudomonadota bacterium]|nr:heme exporter protein CcmB [Pseudomonadota bacterium]